MPANTEILPVKDLRRSSGRRFLIEPDGPRRAALAETLGVLGLRKVRLEGSLSAQGKAGWLLTARLGATATQACVVTLEPVTTRIDTDLRRVFLPEDQMDAPEPGSEIEVPEEDGAEPLADEIDLGAVLIEALSLALPAYPRKPDADLGEAVFAQSGVTPLADSDLRPFAGLGALRDKLAKDDSTE